MRSHLKVSLFRGASLHEDDTLLQLCHSVWFALTKAKLKQQIKVLVFGHLVQPISAELILSPVVSSGGHAAPPP